MGDIDISRDAVEQIAVTCRSRDLFYEADTILALRAAIDRAEAEINTKADFINDLLNLSLIHI